MITETFAPVHISVDAPGVGPIGIFNNATPSFLKENFARWCEMGLVEVGISRDLEKKVIRYIQTEFCGLIDAVYCLATAMGDGRKMRRCLRQYVENYYKKDTPLVDIIKPADFCRAFFKDIARESSQSILCLMLQVVITNTDKFGYQLTTKEIIVLHERYCAIVDAAARWVADIKEGDSVETRAKQKTEQLQV